MAENHIYKKGRKRLEIDTLGQGKRKNASVPKKDDKSFIYRATEQLPRFCLNEKTE